ncbi:MAG TPA: hypothetical protein ENK57_14720 [Polyangiaceae bacterium]|nr:hypothetical protein [Polyangiaceae bacterium]
MPRVSTKVDVCSGHDACPSRPFSSWSPDTEVENIPVTREGDSFQPHGCAVHPPHSAVVSAGSPTVEVNGRRVAYVGASVSCPSPIVATGRSTVTVG